MPTAQQISTHEKGRNVHVHSPPIFPIPLSVHTRSIIPRYITTNQMVACLSCDYRGYRGVWVVAHFSLSSDSLFSPELQQLCISIILGQVVSFGTLPGFAIAWSEFCSLACPRKQVYPRAPSEGNPTRPFWMFIQVTIYLSPSG